MLRLLADEFLWDVASKQVRQCLKGHTFVKKVIWSPDGRRLISGGNDIRIWESATGKLLATLSVGDDTDECFGLAITKDGKLLASGSERGNIRVWDIATGKAVLTLKQAPPKTKPTWKPIRELGKELENNVYCVALSPDDTQLAAGIGPTVRIWDIKALLSADARRGREAVEVSQAPLLCPASRPSPTSPTWPAGRAMGL